MDHVMRQTIGCVLLALLCVGRTVAVADSVFIVEDPPVDFDVIDAEPFAGEPDGVDALTVADGLDRPAPRAGGVPRVLLPIAAALTVGPVVAPVALAIGRTVLDVWRTVRQLAVHGLAGNIEELADARHQAVGVADQPALQPAH